VITYLAAYFYVLLLLLRHIGRKFIKLIATAGILHLESCDLFIRLLRNIPVECWEWLHIGISCLGVAVLSSSCSQIRKKALEEGLLEFIDMEGDSEINEEHCWKIRSASALSLSQIYFKNKSEPLGLLAYEAIRERRRVESNQQVLQQLQLAPSQSEPYSRLQFLFKYVCESLSETYSESQSRDVFLRKYLQTAEKANAIFKKRLDSRKATSNATPKIRELDAILKKSRNFSSSHPSVKNTLDQKQLPLTQSMQNVTPFLQNDSVKVENVVHLSTEPYHRNYQTALAEDERGDAEIESQQLNITANVLKNIQGPSNLLAHRYIVSDVPANTNLDKKKAVYRPDLGSHNRRKLFASPEHKSLKIAKENPAVPSPSPLSLRQLLKK
jgi:hypothetical protein